MTNQNFTIIQPWNKKTQLLVANWYLAEWNIPFDKTMHRFEQIALKNDQFQVVMYLDDKPIATGGVYDHINLLDMKPSLSNCRKWLSQMFTLPDYRGNGYGSAMCRYIQQHAATKDIEKLHLATPSASAFYQRLGWNTSKTLQLGAKHITIMERSLHQEQKIINEYRYEQNHY
ncbi:MAG: GNAT family N-acetyltransferase [Agriterribacter sp.]